VRGISRQLLVLSLCAAGAWLGYGGLTESSDALLHLTASDSEAETAVEISSSGLLEVRTPERTWQGLDYGRLSNQLLLLTRDGQLQRFQLSRAVNVRGIDGEFQPVAQRVLEAELRMEFGSKFKTLRTPHYVICHNTADAFAQETGDLVEQLYRAFTAYFGGRGMGFSKPRFPMVILIFDDESQFREYIAQSPGSAELARLAGIYSVDTNRVALFNAAGRESKKYGNSRWHNLSTVIHEATHQIAFNSGCHQRYADNPVWLAEGIAMYFETPEMNGPKVSWNSVGSLNKPRIERFLTYRKKNRRPDSLKSLLTSDDRFHNEVSAADAYAESYALTYFLINQRMPQFLKYMKMMAAKPTLQQDTPEQRVADFQEAFGQNMRLLDASFLRYIDDLTGPKS
jgi:hypothetical protein